jgi:hypothetical protein
MYLDIFRTIPDVRLEFEPSEGIKAIGYDFSEWFR